MAGRSAGHAGRRHTGRRFARPAGCLGAPPGGLGLSGGAGGGWRPAWSAGEVSTRTPRPGRYPTALPRGRTVGFRAPVRPGQAGHRVFYECGRFWGMFVLQMADVCFALLHIVCHGYFGLNKSNPNVKKTITSMFSCRLASCSRTLLAF